MTQTSKTENPIDQIDALIAKNYNKIREEIRVRIPHKEYYQKCAAYLRKIKYPEHASDETAYKKLHAYIREENFFVQKESYKNKGITKEEQARLARAWQQNQDIEARNKMILQFEPLAISAASAMAKQSKTSFEDLKAEAYEAMIRAIDKYDPDLGWQFATYASNHIRGALGRYVMDMSRSLRVGTNVHDIKIWRNLNRIKNDLEAKNIPWDDQAREKTAKMLDVPVKAIVRMEKSIFSPEVRINAVINTNDEQSTNTKDIEAILNTGDGLEEENLNTDIDVRKAFKIVEKTMEDFSQRERDIIKARYLTPKKISLNEIAEKLKISKERIRQIEANSMTKIRKNLVKFGINANLLF